MKNWHYAVTGFSAFYIAMLIRSALKNYGNITL